MLLGASSQDPAAREALLAEVRKHVEEIAALTKEHVTVSKALSSAQFLAGSVFTTSKTRRMDISESDSSSCSSADGTVSTQYHPQTCVVPAKFISSTTISQLSKDLHRCESSIRSSSMSSTPRAATTGYC